MPGKLIPLEEEERYKSMLIIEKEKTAEGYNLICGVDEAGRGCLLYTSPSPRDRELSRMPSSA